MAVFRIDKTKDYTVMANFHLRDKSLSLLAKFLSLFFRYNYLFLISDRYTK